MIFYNINPFLRVVNQKESITIAPMTFLGCQDLGGTSGVVGWGLRVDKIVGPQRIGTSGAMRRAKSDRAGRTAVHWNRQGHWRVGQGRLDLSAGQAATARMHNLGSTALPTRAGCM